MDNIEPLIELSMQNFNWAIFSMTAESLDEKNGEHLRLHPDFNPTLSGPKVPVRVWPLVASYSFLCKVGYDVFSLPW